MDFLLKLLKCTNFAKQKPVPTANTIRVGSKIPIRMETLYYIFQVINRDTDAQGNERYRTLQYASLAEDCCDSPCSSNYWFLSLDCPQILADMLNLPVALYDGSGKSAHSSCDDAVEIFGRADIASTGKQ